MAVDPQSITSAHTMARLAGFSYLAYSACGIFNTFLAGPSVRTLVDPATLTAA